MNFQRLTFLFAIIFVLPLASFAQEKTDNTNIASKLEKNPMVIAIKSKSAISFEEAVAMYDKETTNTENSAIENEALKQFGFVLLMKNGLLEEGSLEQKKYYMNEQMNLKANLLAYDTFYELLNNLLGSMDAEEIAEISKNFSEKNITQFQETNSYKKAKKQRIKEMRLKDKQIRKMAKANS